MPPREHHKVPPPKRKPTKKTKKAKKAKKQAQLKSKDGYPICPVCGNVIMMAPDWQVCMNCAYKDSEKNRKKEAQ